MQGICVLRSEDVGLRHPQHASRNFLEFFCVDDGAWTQYDIVMAGWSRCIVTSSFSSVSWDGVWCTVDGWFLIKGHVFTGRGVTIFGGPCWWFLAGFVGRKFSGSYTAPVVTTSQEIMTSSKAVESLPVWDHHSAITQNEHFVTL